MEIARAAESLKASVLCLREGLVNSAASQAYYAMFQAAQIALEVEGLMRSQWSHKGLRGNFQGQYTSFPFLPLLPAAESGV